MIGMLIEILVCVLLAATIAYCVRLDGKLKLLKADEQAMRRTITDLVSATEKAERAVAGLRTVVLIPSDLERAKQVNSGVYTESLVAVNGTYDDVNRLASEIAGEEEGWAFVNVNVRPFYAEGSKTLV